jgi:phosphohistidine swiveling domain-containing protein
MTTEAASDTFPVVWDDPADAERCWRFSAEHMPSAVTPLEFELGTQRFLEGFGWGMVPRPFNYYIYFTFGGPTSPPPPPATPDSVREAGRGWREEVLPEVLRHTAHYRETDFASMTNEQLAEEVERLPDVRFRSGQLHTMAVRPHWEGMSLLIEAYKELTGGAELAALRLVQGHPNKSFESAERLWFVSRAAAAIPLVAGRLHAMETGTALETLAALREEPAAASFVAAFDGYLEEYGWRSNAGFGTPTWNEDPAVPFLLLRSYLQTEGYDPREEQRRLIEERESAVRETMARLDGEGRARLQDVLEAACSVAPMLEDHNFFIDQRLACMPRRLVLAAAARLALRKPRDVFFLRSAELCAALRGENTGLDALTTQRREEFAHWCTVTPPAFIGARPPEMPAQQDRPALPDGTPGELRGTGASAGVTRGPARILTSLGEAERLRPGDVLVTSVTQPAWTPLFAVARAVVTEVGGMLSHTAVASREFGIPAVVAVPGATRLLRDGQLIEVDGSAGIVRVIQ